MFRVVLLVDMNAFFASVELLERPELVGKPVIIGVNRGRKIVSTATPEARASGVEKGMPMLQAMQICPKETVLIAPRLLVYENESDEIMKVVDSIADILLGKPVREKVGLDEAYLDLSPFCQGIDADQSLDKARPIGVELIRRIFEQRKLGCKVGIGSNMMTAKIASDRKESTGINVIYDRERVQILRPLKVGDLPGVGEKTEPKLVNSGFVTIGQIQDSTADFSNIVGKSLGSKIKGYSLGEDARVVTANGPPESVSRTETFEFNTDDMAIVGPEIEHFAYEISERLKKIQMEGRVITVRYSFGYSASGVKHSEQRQVTLDAYTSDEQVILHRAIRIVAMKILPSKAFYSIALAVSKLRSNQGQGNLALFN